MKCKICNDEFISQRSLIHHIKKYHNIQSFEDYIILHELVTIKYCKYCGNKSSVNTKNHEFREVCSNKQCITKYAHEISVKSIQSKYGDNVNFGNIPGAREKSKQTKIEKYGDANYNNIEKNKNTCMERYKVDNGSKTPEAKQKISDKYHASNKTKRLEKTKATNNIKYSVDWNLQSNIVKEKRKNTFIKNWQTTHPMKNKEYYENRKKEIKTKYNVEYISQIPYVKDKIKNTKYFKRKEVLLKRFGDLIINFDNSNLVKIKCPVCNNISESNYYFLMQRDKFNVDICLHCNPYKTHSFAQKEILNYIINDLKINAIENYKIPNSLKEIDIFIPEKNIGIEYNGVYWHSEIYHSSQDHIDKKLLAYNENIHLIYIWEDDWRLKRELIKNRIKSVLGIYKTIGARETILKEVSRNDAKVFFENNHIQGFLNAKIYIGLYKDEILLSCMSFGHRNGIRGNEWEIFRFASEANLKIIGAFSKILKYFVKIYNPNKILTYLDLDWANYRNNVYEKNKFIYKSQSIPGYMYNIGGKRESRQQFQKYKLVKQGYDNKKTEVEIMNELGYYRVWNCGNLKYEWTKPNIL